MARLDHVNARIGARRTRLLGADAARELLARPGLEARLAALRSTVAGALLAAAPGGADDAALEEAEGSLREAVAEDAAWVVREAEGSHARRLLEAFLDLDEASVVKAVLRGVSRGAPAAATLAAAPWVPSVPAAGVAAAAGTSDVRSALAALGEAGSTLAAIAAAALPAEGEGALPELELAVDRAAFARARASCRGPGEDREILAAHLEDRIDVRNATTLLLAAGGPLAADPWIEGGRRLTPAALRDAAALPAPAARERIAAAFPEISLASAEPWDAERALDAAVRARLYRQARRQPLSIAVPLWYLLERRAEARRLALVLRGASLGLPLEVILGPAEA